MNPFSETKLLCEERVFQSRGKMKEKNADSFMKRFKPYENSHKLTLTCITNSPLTHTHTPSHLRMDNINAVNRHNSRLACNMYNSAKSKKVSLLFSNNIINAFKTANLKLLCKIMWIAILPWKRRYQRAIVSFKVRWGFLIRSDDCKIVGYEFSRMPCSFDPFWTKIHCVLRDLWCMGCIGGTIS